MASRVPKIRSGSGGPSPAPGSGGASKPPSAADEPTATLRAGPGSMAEATDAVGEESDFAAATALVRARAEAAGPAGGWVVEPRVAGRGGGPMPPVGAAGAGGAARSRVCAEPSQAPAGPGPAARGALPAAVVMPFGMLRGAKARFPLAGRTAPGSEEARTTAVRGEAVGGPGGGVGDRGAGVGAARGPAPSAGGPVRGLSAPALTRCHGRRGAAEAADALGTPCLTRCHGRLGAAGAAGGAAPIATRGARERLREATAEPRLQDDGPPGTPADVDGVGGAVCRPAAGGAAADWAEGGPDGSASVAVSRRGESGC